MRSIGTDFLAAVTGHAPERRSGRGGRQRTTAGIPLPERTLGRRITRRAERLARASRDAPGKIRTCDLCLRRAALYPLSYGRGEGKSSCLTARSSRRRIGVPRNLDPHVGERDDAVAVRRRARHAADDLALEGQLGVVLRAARHRRSRARGACGSPDRGSAAARSAPDPGSSPSRSRPRAARARPRPEGRGRRSRGRIAACRPGSAGARARRRRRSCSQVRRRAPRTAATP